MIISSVDDLQSWIGHNLVSKLTPKTIVLLEGEMGVGKTQFVKSFCSHFGCEREVSSPTFSIIQEYPSSLGPIHHVDLYRIKDSDELEHTGFWEIFSKKKGVVFIEWPQRVGEARINAYTHQGWNIIRIKYEFRNENNRFITIS